MPTSRDSRTYPATSRIVALLASLTLALPAPAARAPKPVELPIAYSAYNAHPKLVILVVIDQFRGDYLDRYHADFKGRGFRLFLDHGAYFPDCYYDYANTKTAPGHATLGTGAYTDGHGISSNEWWDLNRNRDRPISSVEDERYRQVGAPIASPAAATTSGTNPATTPAAAPPANYMAPSDPVLGASPRNLHASTIGDELRLATQGQSRVYGISLKDRASILPAGSAANAAFWIDQASGYFVTSTYYAPQLPAWAAAFNTSGRIEQAYKDAAPPAIPAEPAPEEAPKAVHGKSRALGKGASKKSAGGPAATSTDQTKAPTGVDPVKGVPESGIPVGPMPTGKGFYGIVGSTPAANSYELDFARALIQGEQLGQHPTTDLVTISLSANDIMGHQAGPDSAYERQMVDGLDTDLDSFFTWLDKNVEGRLPNVMIALSADHGIAPIPAEAAKLGMPAVSVSLGKIVTSLNDAMNLKFSPGENVTYLLGHQELPYIAINGTAFEKAGINELEAETAVQNALPAAVEALSPAPPASPSETRLPPRPTLIGSYTRLQLAAGEVPPTDFGRILAHSYSANGGWYLMAVFGDYQMEQLTGSTQTTHFSPWSYDRHVPLGFYGAPIAPGIYRGRVAPVDLAATLASILGINQPSASVGHILTQALRPDTAVSYPLPVVLPVHPRRRGGPPTKDSAADTAVPNTAIPDATAKPAPAGPPAASPATSPAAPPTSRRSETKLDEKPKSAAIHP